MRTTASAPLAAFSLIEVMIAMGLLTFIVIGLLAMFNQTQRAFKLSITQTDVLASGRASMDQMGREVEQMTPSESPDVFWGNAWHRTTNFFVEPSPYFPNPLQQELPGNSLSRSNFVQRFFFLSRLNQDWIGTGYQVLPDDANGCVGTLYRVCVTNASRRGPLTVSSVFYPPVFFPSSPTPVAPMTNRIADGVVHFRVRAFATNGVLVVRDLSTNGVFDVSPYRAGPYIRVRNTTVYGSPRDPAQAACYFLSNAVPAYVELEVGILEQPVLQRYRSIPVAAAQRQYLSNHVAQVHIFRQRIPIRNVDFSAYQ